MAWRYRAPRRRSRRREGPAPRHPPAPPVAPTRVAHRSPAQPRPLPRARPAAPLLIASLPCLDSVHNRYRCRSGADRVVVIGAGQIRFSKETPMKYMMLIAGDESRWADASDAAREGYRRVGEWWDAEAKAGRIVEGHELEPSSTATTVRVD